MTPLHLRQYISNNKIFESMPGRRFALNAFFFRVFDNVALFDDSDSIRRGISGAAECPTIGPNERGAAMARCLEELGAAAAVLPAALAYCATYNSVNVEACAVVVGDGKTAANSVAKTKSSRYEDVAYGLRLAHELGHLLGVVGHLGHDAHWDIMKADGTISDDETNSPLTWRFSTQTIQDLRGNSCVIAGACP
ncbi:MAG: hypothetical protein H6747_12460 [Deltaproteobacteria bacterium]|nr:hypothetical protein [Deltaproteobacteria bacterium]